MKPRIKKYTAEEIIMLSKALYKKEEAYEWLKENDCKELAALTDVLLHDNKSALTFLRQFNFEIITEFLGALDDHPSSYKYLMESDSKEWAAVISMLNNSSDALAWLTKNELNHFAIFSKTLSDVIISKDKTGNNSFGFA